LNHLTDRELIKKTIQLAKKGKGYVSPNPLVGSIIVKNGKIIGEGYHRCFGREHAEIVALRQVCDEARGATLYVNLEPCCHFGKTPPCTEAIIKAGISQVVIGMVDPNPLVNQQGIKILLENGIEVEHGIEKEACEQLNRAFIKYIQTGMPYVTLKIAQSLDGRIATSTGHSKWITSEPARKEAHRLRAENDVILVGIETVLADDPQLTVRMVKGDNPVRIILDSRLRIPLDCQMLCDEFGKKTIVATSIENMNKIEKIKNKGAHVWIIEKDANGQISLPELLKKIGRAKKSTVMVEGGAEIFTSFLREKLADRIVFALAPKILGAGKEAIGDLGITLVDDGVHLKSFHLKKVGVDLIVDGFIS